MVNVGRSTRAYVSGYQRARVHVGTVRRQEKRYLVADFNAAIPAGVTITSATWRTTNPWSMSMSLPTISGREVSVLVDFQNSGRGAIKATITLSNGEVYNQLFEYIVRDAPWFDEPFALTAGPFSVTATA